jgi:hypothetical protein
MDFLIFTVHFVEIVNFIGVVLFHIHFGYGAARSGLKTIFSGRSGSGQKFGIHNIAAQIIHTVSSTNRNKNAENWKKLAIEWRNKKTCPIPTMGGSTAI